MSDHNQYVISTEYLFISDRTFISNIIDFLRNFFSKIEVFLFVRDPVDYYRSMQQQMIKARSFVISPLHFQYNFKNVIEAWSEFCTVHVLKYDKDKNACRSFCNKIGINFDRLTRTSQKRNRSMSIEQMVLMEKIQRNLYKDYEDIFKPHLNNIYNINASFIHKPALKKAVKCVLYDAHYGDLDWLKRNYFIDFMRERRKNKSNFSFSTQSKRISIRDVYKVDEDSTKRYESACMNFLLKKLHE